MFNPKNVVEGFSKQSAKSKKSVQGSGFDARIMRVMSALDEAVAPQDSDDSGLLESIKKDVESLSQEISGIKKYLSSPRTPASKVSDEDFGKAANAIDSLATLIGQVENYFRKEIANINETIHRQNTSIEGVNARIDDLARKEQSLFLETKKLERAIIESRSDMSRPAARQNYAQPEQYRTPVQQPAQEKMPYPQPAVPASGRRNANRYDMREKDFAQEAASPSMQENIFSQQNPVSPGNSDLQNNEPQQANPAAPEETGQAQDPEMDSLIHEAKKALIEADSLISGREPDEESLKASMGKISGIADQISSLCENGDYPVMLKTLSASMYLIHTYLENKDYESAREEIKDALYSASNQN